MSKLLKDSTVPITLNGVKTTLLYSMESFLELEEIYLTTEKVFDALASTSMKDMITLLWAGTLHHEPCKSIKELAREINFEQLIELTPVVLKAIADSLPDVPEKEKKEGENPEQQPQEGEQSGEPKME